MNQENTYKFGNHLGTYIKSDKGLTDLRLKGYQRVQVRVDVLKSLKSSVFIKNDDGSTQWLPFKYERLYNFCFNCGRLGHTVGICSSPPPDNHGALDPRLAFGPWMRANGNSSPLPSTDWSFESKVNPRQEGIARVFSKMIQFF